MSPTSTLPTLTGSSGSFLSLAFAFIAPKTTRTTRARARGTKRRSFSFAWVRSSLHLDCCYRLYSYESPFGFRKDEIVTGGPRRAGVSPAGVGHLARRKILKPVGRDARR